MARKETKHRPVNATTVIQIPLMPDQVTEIKSMSLKHTDVIKQLGELTKDGYSLSLTWDMDREQYSARLAGIDAISPNAGKLLYGNGKTQELAYLALYAKHFLGSMGGKWEEGSSASLDMS